MFSFLRLPLDWNCVTFDWCYVTKYLPLSFLQIFPDLFPHFIYSCPLWVAKTIFYQTHNRYSSPMNLVELGTGLFLSKTPSEEGSHDTMFPQSGYVKKPHSKLDV